MAEENSKFLYVLSIVVVVGLAFTLTMGMFNGKSSSTASTTGHVVSVSAPQGGGGARDGGSNWRLLLRKDRTW